MEEEIKTLSFKYFEGTASPDEEKRLFGLLKASKEGEKAFKLAENQWRSSHHPSYGVQSALGQVHRAIERRRQKRIYKYVSFSGLGIAAALALFFFISPRATSPVQIPQTQDLVVYALPGSTSRIILPDSSSVCLNAGSVIRYSSDFNKADRNVYLTGEAFFDVAKNPRKPFVVHTSECTFTVLGTKFDICAYEGDEELYAVLTDGSLKVRTGDLEDILSPGDKFSKAGSGYTKEKVDTDQYTSWLNRAVKFDRIKVPLLLKRLERMFDIRFVMETALLDDREIRVSFSGEDSIESILSTLEQLLPMNIVRNEKEYHVFDKITRQ